jgi:hypothetical protein
LTDGLVEERETAKLTRTLDNCLSIPQGLIFDGAGKESREILGADFSFQDTALEGRNQHIHGADVLLTMCHEQTSLFRGRIQTYLERGFAHDLLCLSMDCSMTSALTFPAVEEKVLPVQREGIFLRKGNSSLRSWADRPLIRLAISVGRVEGFARRNKWT